MSAPGAPAALPAAGQRGRTTVADRVVARVAEQAVAEAGKARGAPRERTGNPGGRTAGAGTARAWARVDGELAVIEVRLSLAYPVPLRALTRDVRGYVIERVSGLTGLEVRHVDIEVARLLRGREG